jgi:NAD(P)-dependent dehydrogenase (short-subunit alcohol dehydrogenase family)
MSRTHHEQRHALCKDILGRFMSPWTLVTGDSGGLGFEIALLLAQKDWNLILAERRGEKLRALKERLTPLCEAGPFIAEIDLSEAGGGGGGGGGFAPKMAWVGEAGKKPGLI